MGKRMKDLSRIISLLLCLQLMLSFGSGLAFAEYPPGFIRAEGVSLSTNYLELRIGDAPVQLSCLIRPSNATNQEVTWSSADSTIASVANGLVTPHKVGMVGIRVVTVSEGQADYCLVSVLDPAVKVTSLTVSPKSLNMIAGRNSQTISATISPDTATNKEVTWSSDNPFVAEVHGGIVTPIGAGTTVIRATSANNTNATDSCTVQVSEAGTSVTGIVLDKSSLTMNVGQSETLEATVSPSNASYKGIKWSSSDGAVVSVSSTGGITAVAPGSARISAVTEDGNFQATCQCTVTGLRLNKNSTILAVGDSETLLPTTYGANTGIQWTSDNASIASVDSQGKITALKNGVTSIRASLGGSTAHCSVTVYTRAQSIELSQTSLQLYQYGNPVQITARVQPEGAAQSVFWSSSNTSAATVKDGLVTPVRAGTTDITASTTNSDGSKSSAVCAVTVNNPLGPSSISIQTSKSIYLGRSEKISATVLPGNADQRVKWLTNNSSVVSVDTAGLLKGNALGTATITVKTNDEKYTANCQVTVVPVKATGIKLNTNYLYLDNIDRKGDWLTATISPSDTTNTKVIWTIDNTSLAGVRGCDGASPNVKKAWVDVINPRNSITTVTATTEDGSFSDYCELHVSYTNADGTPSSSYNYNWNGLKFPIINTSSGSTSSTSTSTTTTNPIKVPSEPTVMKPGVSGFTDMAGNWADSTVKTLVNKGIMKGYADGTFKPNKSMNRFEFIVALSRTVGLKADDKAKIIYTDAKSIPVWAKGYVAAACKAGIIPTVWGKEIHGDYPVTRAEASYMVTKGLKLPVSTKLKALFKDKTPVWAEPYVAVAVQKGLVNGFPDKTFKAFKALTRAEASNILNNLIKTKK